jgi:hypothetical protein
VEDEMDYENDQERVEKSFEDLISKKCMQHCGMRRAWPDGLCHATADMCCLVPHSPIWAGREILAAPVVTPDWGDL